MRADVLQRGAGNCSESPPGEELHCFMGLGAGLAGSPPKFAEFKAVDNHCGRGAEAA